MSATGTFHTFRFTNRQAMAITIASNLCSGPGAENRNKLVVKIREIAQTLEESAKETGLKLKDADYERVLKDFDITKVTLRSFSIGIVNAWKKEGLTDPQAEQLEIAAKALRIWGWVLPQLPKVEETLDPLDDEPEDLDDVEVLAEELAELAV